MVIIVSYRGENARRVDSVALENESLLQEYIKKNPSAILSELKSGTRTLAFREFPTKVTGPVDILAIDADGDIYVLETKLERNTTKREVVAQAMDYSAALWYHYTEDEFIDAIEALVHDEFHVPFESKVKELFEIEDEDGVTAFIERVKSNLRNGNFKIIVLMDKLDERLKEMINFMNQKSKFTVYAIEIEQYRIDDNTEVVIPKSFGTEVKKEVASGSEKWIWNEDSYFEVARSKLSPGEIKVIQRLYDFAKFVSADGQGEIRWGAGKTPSFRLFVYKVSESESIYSAYADGHLWISTGFEDVKKGQHYVNELSKVPEFRRMLNDKQKNYYPRKDEWMSASEAFLDAVNSLIRSYVN